MNDDFFKNMFGQSFGVSSSNKEEKVDLAPYVLKIKKLEKQVNFLAKQCASLHTQHNSTNLFKNNSDYWIEQSEKE